MPDDRARPLTMWGLKTCDTCRKARRWLDDQGLAYRYRDVRDDGVAAAELRAWARSPEGDSLVNRRSTTWRTLGDADRARAETDRAGLLAEYPTLVRRPVFVRGGELIAVGFTPAARERLAGG